MVPPEAFTLAGWGPGRDRNLGNRPAPTRSPSFDNHAGRDFDRSMNLHGKSLQIGRRLSARNGRRPWRPRLAPSMARPWRHRVPRRQARRTWTLPWTWPRRRFAVVSRCPGRGARRLSRTHRRGNHGVGRRTPDRAPGRNTRPPAARLTEREAPRTIDQLRSVRPGRRARARGSTPASTPPCPTGNPRGGPGPAAHARCPWARWWCSARAILASPSPSPVATPA